MNAPVGTTERSPTEGPPYVLAEGAVQPLAHHRISVEQYHRMIETGILGEDDRVELLDGWIVALAPSSPGHSYGEESLYEAIRDLLPKEWIVRQQKPVALLSSEPEPDLQVVRGSLETYRQRHAGPEDIGLLVEVAHASLAIDRQAKLAIYAAAGIPEYWIVNLIDRQIEVYRQVQPARGTIPAGYAEERVFAEGEAAPLVLDDKKLGEIPVADVMP